MTAVSPVMVYIDGGQFLMGSDSGQDDESPPHLVQLSPFRMGQYAVTNREYASFMSSTGAPAPSFWNRPPFDHPEMPVVAVNWFDAEAYCRWLTAHSDDCFRLPTEAEREFACRAGTTTAYPWGDHAEDAPCEPQDYGARWAQGPEIVGGRPNAFGLCNMSDNVHEWCGDWYSREYYRASPAVDPKGPRSGRRRASRGGSWRHHVKVTRSSARSSLDPTYKYSDYGFRVACEARLGMR